VADFKRLQHDELSLQARTLVPMVLAAARRAGRAEQWAYATLGRWDYVMRREQTAPLLFESWKRALSTAALRRAGGPDPGLSVIGGSCLDEWTSQDSALTFFPAPARDSLMLSAMESALADIRRRMGSDTSTWRWGTLHTASFPNKAASALDAGTVGRGGDGSTVNSTSGSEYRQVNGASFREILDVADWDNSAATSVPGQSGQPESAYYANLLPLWERGEYFPLVYSRAAVERETRHVLWLKPGPGGGKAGRGQ
jgi:penicillin amidase